MKLNRIAVTVFIFMALWVIRIHAEAAIQFAPAVNYSAGVGSIPWSMAAGDVDGDADLDLAVANFGNGGGNTVSVLKNNGNGTYQAGAQFFAGSGPISVKMAKLDGDGDLDLAVANRLNSGGSNPTTILFNDGTGAFTSQPPLTAGSQPWDVQVGDVDADNDIDLVVGNQNSNNVSVFLNNGNGTFAAAANYPAPFQTTGVALADLDGDGDLDVATATAVPNGQTAILLNNGNGTYTPFGLNPLPNGALRIIAADLDGDGDKDLAATHITEVAILRNNGNATFQPPVFVPAGGSNMSSVAAGDFDGDGDLDLAAANSSSNNVSVMANNGGGTFGAPLILAGGTNPQFVTAGDLNGDGNVDLAVANAAFSSGTPSVSVFIGAPNKAPVFLMNSALPEHIWVSVSGTQQVAKINKTTNAVDAFISTPGFPEGQSVGPDTFVWVAAVLSGVARLNKTTNTVEAVIPPSPGSLVQVDATHVWATDLNGIAIRAINRQTSMIDSSFPPPAGLTFGGFFIDPQFIWATMFPGSMVMKFGKTTGTLLDTILAPKSITFVTGDEDFLWGTHHGNGGGLTKIDRHTGVVTFLPFGINTYEPTVDDSFVWVSDVDLNSVLKINRQTDLLVATIPVGANPRGVSDDRTHVYVANRFGSSVSKISKQTNAVVATVPVGGQVFAIGDMTGLEFFRIFGRIPEQFLSPGQTQTSVFNLNDFFRDPEGDPLTFTASAGGHPNVTVVVNPNGSVDLTASATFAGGESIVFTATDPSGNSAASNIVRLELAAGAPPVDVTPPVISNAAATPSVLWPPNHKMVNVSVAATVQDDQDPSPTLKIVSVTSSEPDNGLGDGDAPGDIVITGDLTVQLRAERSGKGIGRFYTITLQAEDASGNTSTATVTVTVPKSQKK